MEYTSIEELYRLFLMHPIISKDTRQISDNCIYFALKGDSFDGNQFAIQAIEKGAKYAVIDDPNQKRGDQYLLVKDCLTTLQQLANYHRNQLHIPIIAISGSNGKTTTKELIAAVLSQKYNTLFTLGNYNNHIGVPLTLLRIKEEHEIAVVEMGANHQKEIEFLCKIAEPNFGLLTNIGKAHLEGFGGIEGIKKGKSELYRFLEQENNTTFINNDDAILMELNLNDRIITYGKNDKAYCIGSLTQTHPVLKGNWACNNKTGVISPQLYGEYNFYNILAAICIGNYFNVDDQLISEAINSYQSEMNRSQIKLIDDFKVYLDAYNANPTSVKLAIENFEKAEEKEKIAILGDMFELGDEAIHEHKNIIDQLKEVQSFSAIVLVGENFFHHQFNNERFLFFNSTETAKSWFDSYDKSGKTFLLKGSRGMKIETLLNKKAEE